MYCNPEVWVKSTFPPPACFWLERVFITAREIIIEHRDPRRGMINTEWFGFLWGSLSLTYPRWRLPGLSRDNYWYPSLHWWTRGSDWSGNIYCSEGRGWMDYQRTGTTEDIQLHLLKWLYDKNMYKAWWVVLLIVASLVLTSYSSQQWLMNSATVIIMATQHHCYLHRCPAQWQPCALFTAYENKALLKPAGDDTDCVLHTWQVSRDFC